MHSVSRPASSRAPQTRRPPSGWGKSGSGLPAHAWLLRGRRPLSVYMWSWLAAGSVCCRAEARQAQTGMPSGEGGEKRVVPATMNHRMEMNAFRAKPPLSRASGYRKYTLASLARHPGTARQLLIHGRSNGRGFLRPGRGRRTSGGGRSDRDVPFV
ncbi:hypothetical protein AAFF_G00072140 [Aldrovandia affinis]|uniref:Uncharacterized protein n=1 Tax=Aldrovandia affinis TaxID=143900 RepID=A0AAD7WDM4_9TELE|nr:hypothetical protein AAFF_G00072140 [Aldrovandia affinis]